MTSRPSARSCGPKWASSRNPPPPPSPNACGSCRHSRASRRPGTNVSATPIALPAPGELPEPGPLPRNTVLPYARNPDFTGRAADLLNLAEQLAMLGPAMPREAAPQPPIAAITGMGGLGKTQLAAEFAYRYGRFFPGGVYWIRFADPDSVSDEVAATGGERGLGLYQDADNLTTTDRVGRVRRAWQEPVPRLLIFDNCETEELLAAWRPVTGGCRVLLTSRRAAWARELHVQAHPLAVWNENRAWPYSNVLSPQAAESALGEIAQAVGDLPLALHLAGSFLARYRQVSPEEYLAQLHAAGPLEHSSMQGRGAAYSPTGHDLDVARTFGLSLAQLDPADETEGLARQLLARAACLAPGEPIPVDLLLATVAEDEPDLLAELSAQDALARLQALGFLSGGAARRW